MYRVTSVLMHRSIEFMEIGKFTMERNKLAKIRQVPHGS